MISPQRAALWGVNNLTGERIILCRRLRAVSSETEAISNEPRRIIAGAPPQTAVSLLPDEGPCAQATTLLGSFPVRSIGTRVRGLTVLALVLPAPGRRSATSAKTGPEKVMAGVAPSSAVEDGIGPAGT